MTKTSATLKTIESMIPKKSHALAFLFFAVFSRFEYALKSSGWKTGTDKKCDADWDAFSDRNDKDFHSEDSPELKEACDYFTAHPPKKQVIKHGAIEWVEGPFPKTYSPLRKLLLAVRRVRNNMFHGGKFPLNSADGDRRNEKLLEYALVILDACARLDKHVHHHLIHRR